MYNFFNKDYKTIEDLFFDFEKETHENIDGFRVGILCYLQNKNRYKEFFGNDKKYFNGYKIGMDYAKYKGKEALKEWLE